MNLTRRQERVRIALQWLFLALSAVATADGFYDIIAGSTENPNPFMLAAAIVLAFLIVALMWFALEHALKRSVSRAMRITSGFLYVFFMLWSLSFGYGFYWKMFAATDHARDNFALVGRAVTKQLQKAQAPLGQVRSSSSTILAASTGKIRNEIDGNGSCDNDTNHLRGGGPYCRTRVAIAGEVTDILNGLNYALSDGKPFTPLSAPTNAETCGGLAETPKPPVAQQAAAPSKPTAAPNKLSVAASKTPPVPAAAANPAVGANTPSSLEAQITAVIDDFGSKNDSKASINQDDLAENLKARMIAAQALISKTNGAVESIKTDSVPRLKELGEKLSATGGGYPGELLCVDRTLSDNLIRAAKALKEIPQVPDIPIEDMTPTLGAKATREAFFRVWGVVLSPVMPAAQKSKEALKQEDWIAGFAAVAVDVSILGSTILRRRRTLDDLNRVLRTRIRSPRLRRVFSDLIRHNGPDLRVLFERSSVTFRGKHYLFATDYVRPYAASISNVQTALSEAGEGYLLQNFSEGAPWYWSLRSVILPHHRRRLIAALGYRIALTTRQLQQEQVQNLRGRSLPPIGQGWGEHIAVMVVSHSVWTALQLTADEIIRDGPYDPPPRPSRPTPGFGPSGSDPGPRDNAYGFGQRDEPDDEPPPRPEPRRSRRPQGRAQAEQAAADADEVRDAPQDDRRDEPHDPQPEPFAENAPEPPPASQPNAGRAGGGDGLDFGPEVTPRAGPGPTLPDRPTRPPTLREDDDGN